MVYQEADKSKRTSTQGHVSTEYSKVHDIFSPMVHNGDEKSFRPSTRSVPQRRVLSQLPRRVKVD